MKLRKKLEGKVKKNFFGGSTSVEGRGEYLLKGKYIPERVSIVHSYSTKRKYKFNKRKWISWCKKKKRQWSQDSLGIGIEGDMYYV